MIVTYSPVAVKRFIALKPTHAKLAAFAFKGGEDSNLMRRPQA